MLMESPDGEQVPLTVKWGGLSWAGGDQKASGQAGRPRLSRKLTSEKRKRQVVRAGASCEDPKSSWENQRGKRESHGGVCLSPSLQLI